MNARSWAGPGVLAALLLLAWLPVAAAEAAAPLPTIKQGLDAAWARQPEQQAAALRRDAAVAALAAAQRWTPEPPSLELRARTDRPERNEGQREYETALAVPLWLPGERLRAQAAARAEAAAVDERLLAAQWRLAGEVREAYWAHQRARLEHELAQQRLLSAQQLAADVARRTRAGDLPRADAHQAEAATAAAQGALAEAAVALAVAGQRWSALTGLPPPGAQAAGEPAPAPEPTPLEGDHPALRELAARHAAARRQSELAGVQVRPNPEVTVGATRERDAYGARYGQAVVVGLRIPLGTSGTGRSRQATAAADAVEAGSQLELEAVRVRSQAEAAKAQLNALQQALEAAQRRAALARESRGFFEKSFRLGETDLPTRLRTEQEAFEAERQAARSRIELQAAVSQLRQALGLLPE